MRPKSGCEGRRVVPAIDADFCDILKMSVVGYARVGELDLSQVPRDGNTTVAWYWQCDRGHRWRETTYSRLDFPLRYRRPPSRNMPRWKNFGGTRAACRQCA